MKAKATVLKIGGSVITHKKKPLTANEQAIDRLSEEIFQARVPRLILVHGGGSFGHPLAKQYRIKEGYRSVSDQLLGFSKTRQGMMTLNKLVVDALIRHNIPVVTVSPSSFIVTKSGRITSVMEEPLKRLLQMDFVPLLHGDAVLDADLGFTILSGDQIVVHTAIEFDAERIVMGIDEDGLFTADPKKDGSARLITNCSLDELEKMRARMKKIRVDDVTGGMLGKIIELSPAIEKGISALIVNASKPKTIYKALAGEKVTGTLIQKT